MPTCEDVAEVKHSHTLSAIFRWAEEPPAGSAVMRLGFGQVNLIVVWLFAALIRIMHPQPRWFLQRIDLISDRAAHFAETQPSPTAGTPFLLAEHLELFQRRYTEASEIFLCRFASTPVPIP